VVQSLRCDPAASANDKLARLIFFVTTLKDHGAARIPAIVRTKPGDPATSRYLAQLFEAIGTQCRRVRQFILVARDPPRQPPAVPRACCGAGARSADRGGLAGPGSRGRSCGAKHWSKDLAARSAKRSPTSGAVQT
jgi:hypothetical protein